MNGSDENTGENITNRPEVERVSGIQEKGDYRFHSDRVKKMKLYMTRILKILKHFKKTKPKNPCGRRRDQDKNYWVK